MSDYEKKRIDYINNWPNASKFDVERQYEEKFLHINDGIPFLPFKMKRNSNVSYNKAISFMIDAFESLGSKPNHSFSYIFSAYDIYGKSLASDNITERNKFFIPIWSNLINNDSTLTNHFNDVLSHIPHKSLQFLFRQIYNVKVQERICKDYHQRINPNRSSLFNAIVNKYSNNYCDYNSSLGVREGSRLLYHVLNDSSVNIDGTIFPISLEDKLHILISGFIYSLRNETFHGSTISCTKSSYSTMATMANSYYAFLLLYYLLLLLIIENTSTDKNNDIIELSNNLKTNIANYKALFGHHLSA